MSTVAAPEAPAITRPVTDADVLERAADLLEEFEHAKGFYAKDLNGWHTTPCASNVTSFCISGAVARALVDLGIGEGDDGKYGFRFLFSRGVFDPVSESAVRWNDMPDRTRGEVVARLRGAAQRARQPD